MGTLVCGEARRGSARGGGAIEVAEIVNLRLARKARDRATAARVAAANRAKFGRTRAEREAEAVERARIDRTLDGAKRDD